MLADLLFSFDCRMPQPSGTWGLGATGVDDDTLTLLTGSLVRRM